MKTMFFFTFEEFVLFQPNVTDAEHVYVLCSFHNSHCNCCREEREAMGETQRAYAQLTQCVDYSLGPMEVLFSPVEKHRFK